MFHINFDHLLPQVLCHPTQSFLVPKILDGLKNYELHHHFILFSSGTTGGELKGYALSQNALFANANAVNKHFNLTKNDIWGLSLPTYHVGGLSVLARANLLGNKIIDVRHWDPLSWQKKMEDVTITSVVPTQLYDLVRLNIRPSKNLRYLIVGGDFLSSGLKERAMALGWPVIRTFGMSEVSSQIASSQNPNSDQLEILSIHKIKIGMDQKLLIKSDSLFTLKFVVQDSIVVTPSSELCDIEGYYPTQDRAEITGNTLKHLGRLGDEFKIAGHLINFGELKEILQNELLKENLFGQMEFILEDDERKGKRLVLLGLPGTMLSERIKSLSDLIHPVKIDQIKEVPSFSRTDLGKLKKSP